MEKPSFGRDEKKNLEIKAKHGVAFPWPNKLFSIGFV